MPPSPLATVCSHEQWDEIYARIGGARPRAPHDARLRQHAQDGRAHRRAADRRLGEDAVTSHHGSLSRERRLDAEERLKAGKLRALVATASLELGIDIGDVDLVIQVGATRSIATFLQRVGRAGHALTRIPKGRLFPLTLDELVEGAALVECVRRGDARPHADAAAAARHPGAADRRGLRRRGAGTRRGSSTRSAAPGRTAISRATTSTRSSRSTPAGRRALLHRDGVGGRLMATKRARLTALLSGGAIPDTADYQVRLEPEGTLVGTVNEDWAIESNGGDIFQLGNASWRILRIEPGIVRVADAKGAAAVAAVLARRGAGAHARARGRDRRAARGVRGAGRRAAGFLPVGLRRRPAGGRRASRSPSSSRRAGASSARSRRRGASSSSASSTRAAACSSSCTLPFGSRINRAWGLALRKKFCVGFGFELQAAANEEAIVLSLGPQHSFELEDVFDYLHPRPRARGPDPGACSPRRCSRRAGAGTRSGRCCSSALAAARRSRAPLLRMRANDLLAAAFPQVLACPETLPGGPIAGPDGPSRSSRRRSRTA